MASARWRLLGCLGARKTKRPVRLLLLAMGSSVCSVASLPGPRTKAMLFPQQGRLKTVGPLGRASCKVGSGEAVAGVCWQGLNINGLCWESRGKGEVQRTGLTFSDAPGSSRSKMSCCSGVAVLRC